MMKSLMRVLLAMLLLIGLNIAVLALLSPVTFPAKPSDYAVDVPSPEQIISRSDFTIASCEYAARNVVEPPAQPLDFSHDTPGYAEAVRTADSILTHYFAFTDAQFPADVGGPYLEMLNNRRIWVRVWIPYSRGEVDYSQNAAVLFLDAETNQPLTLFTDVTVIDPVFVCEHYPDSAAMAFIRPKFPDVAIIAALFLSDVFFVVWLFRSRRVRREFTAT